MKDKLIELLTDDLPHCDNPLQGIYDEIIERLAEHLIECGVIVLLCKCQDCVYSVPLDNNCELNSNVYLHCTLGRGEQTKNVWHKYKKYYKDYSIVERDGFCDDAGNAEQRTLMRGQDK